MVGQNGPPYFPDPCSVPVATTRILQRANQGAVSVATYEHSVAMCARHGSEFSLRDDCVLIARMFHVHPEDVYNDVVAEKKRHGYQQSEPHAPKRDRPAITDADVAGAGHDGADSGDGAQSNVRPLRPGRED